MNQEIQTIHLTEEENAQYPEVQMPSFEPPITPALPKGVAENCSLSEAVQKMAWMEAGGMPPWAIEQSLGLQPGTVLSQRTEVEYRNFVSICVRERARARIFNGGEDIEEVLNEQILDNIATIVEVRDNPFEKGQTRLKAAQDLMDRAPKAPKAKREVEERRTIISIPIGELQTMQQALLEEGTKEDKEIIELLKGVDYTEGEGNEKEEIKFKSFD